MIDLGLLLRTAYYERLNSVITYNQSLVPVYDSSSVPADALEPYILLGDFISSEIGEGSKQNYGQECFQTVEVITKMPNAVGGKEDSDNIAYSVIALVRTRQSGYMDLGTEFTMITTLLDSTFTLNELAQDGMIVRRIIRFRHLIYQNNNS